jgi:outer membrane protein
MTKKLIMAICLAQCLAQAHAEDLIQIFDLALQEDPSIHQAEANRAAMLETKPQSIARLLPTLAIAGTLNQSRYDTQNTFTNAQLGVQNFWDSTLYLKMIQPIYHNEYWVNLDQADNQVAQAEAEYAAAEQALFVRTAKAYFDVLLAEEELESAKAEKRTLEKQLNQINKRFDAGLATGIDVHEAQSGYDQSVAAEIAAQRKLRVANVAMQEIIGAREVMLNPLNSALPMQPPTPKYLEDWKTMAQQDNPAIIAAQNQAEIARKSIDLQFSGHFPSLDLVGSVGIADTNRPAGLVANSQSIGLQLNVPIFQGGSVNSKVRQARHQLESALANVDKQRRTVDRQIEDAHYGIESSINQVRALQTTLESSEATVHATEAGVRAGIRTMVDVITAQRNFYRAQRDYARARYDYILNSLLLKQGAGALSRQDLEAVNNWLH